MRKFSFGLSLVLPAFNEEENIEPVTIIADGVLRHLLPRYEIWLVDDGSRDGTAAAIERVKAEYPAVRSITHDVNKGYGVALRNAFAAATMPYVAFTDSDRQFDIVDIERLLPLAEQNDLVVGYRLRRLDPFVRKIYSRGYGLLIRTLFDLHVRDLNCALKLMERQKLLALGLRSDHYFINVEMLVKARARGYRIAEVGVKHLPRAAGESKVTLSQIPNTLREVRRLYRELKHNPVGAHEPAGSPTR
ncbi:MAG: glycosyltransferase family 2 protein [Acidobacteriota bacterium]